MKRLIHQGAILIAVSIVSGCGPAFQQADPVPTLFEMPAQDDPATPTPATLADSLPTATSLPQEIPTATPQPTATFVPVDPLTLYREAPCPLDLPDYRIEGIEVTCGTVTVPEEHANPAGSRIELAVAVLHSTAEMPAPDPLVMEQGGPGGSTLELFVSFMYHPLLEEIREKRDIVLIEQRGTLHSDPFLFCKDNENLRIETLDYAFDRSTLQEAFQDAAGGCRKRYSFDYINPSAYDSVENAADIALAVSALGYDQFNLYGVSYGTLLAQHVMRDYPDRLRAVILDAAIPMDTNFVARLPANADRSLKRVFAACAASTACARQYPGLETAFSSAVARLNENPPLLQVADPDFGIIYDYRFTGDAFVEMVTGFLYYTDLLPLIPLIISDVANGGYTFVQLAAPGTIVDRDFADGLYFAVVCSEYDSFSSNSAGLSAPFSRMAAGFEAEFTSACAGWDVEALPAKYRVPASSPIPVLILSGAYDPVTPPSFGDAAARPLPAAQHVVLPSNAHGAIFSSTCADSLISSFIASPGQVNTSCVQDMRGLRFYIPGGADVPLKQVTIADDNIRTVAPGDWDELEPGVFARNNSPIDAVLLWIGRLPGGMDERTVLSYFEDALSSRHDAVFVTEKQSRSLDWSIYRMDTNGYPVNVAIGSSEFGVEAYIVLSANTSQELLALAQTVLFPAIEAFEFTD